MWVPSLKLAWLKEKDDCHVFLWLLQIYSAEWGRAHTHRHQETTQKGDGFPSSCLTLGPTLKAQDTKKMDVQAWVSSVTLPYSLIFWNRVWLCYPGWPWIYNSPVSAWVLGLWLCAIMWDSDSLSLETSRLYEHFSLSPPLRVVKKTFSFS